MDDAANSQFLGTGWAFPPEFDSVGCHVKMVSAAEDIRESLRILFSTHPGERTMLPAYGCPLRPRVFDPMDTSFLAEIRDVIERAVLFFEPRITLDHIEINIEDPLGGILRIHLFYTIRTTNTRDNLVYPFHYIEATNVAD